MLLAVLSDRAAHFAVLIAKMRQVAIRSEGPIFGQFGSSLWPPILSPTVRLVWGIIGE